MCVPNVPNFLTHPRLPKNGRAQHLNATSRVRFGFAGINLR